MENETKTLYCTNPKCQAKHVKSFTLFVSRDAMNIEGLSEATLEKFIMNGYIKDFADLFHLDRYADEIRQMEGFGDKSYENLQNSIKKRTDNDTSPVSSTAWESRISYRQREDDLRGARK